MAKVITDESQLERANDQCMCKSCGVMNAVTVVPEAKASLWICKNCNEAQRWKPSANFRLQVEGAIYNMGGVTNIWKVGKDDIGNVSRETDNGRTWTLFSLGPFTGLGADGCMTGVNYDPSLTINILIVGAVIGMLAVAIEWIKGNRKV